MIRPFLLRSPINGAQTSLVAMAKILHRKTGNDAVQKVNGADKPAAPAFAPKVIVRKRVEHKEVNPEDTDEYKKMMALLQKLTVQDSPDNVHGDSADMLFKVANPSVLQSTGVLDQLKAATENAKDAETKEAALLIFAQLAERTGSACEPYLLPLVPLFLDSLSDKSAGVRATADAAGRQLMSVLCNRAAQLVLPVVLDHMTVARKWQVKEGALKLLAALARRNPAQVAAALPAIVPVVSECMVDARAQVKEAAWQAAAGAFALVGNRDIEPLVPALMSCIARPAEVPDTITKLSGTTFVQAVEAPALAIMVPLLIRGLQPSSITPIKRKTAVIIANMAKLVNNPSDAHLFLPRLLPGLERAAEEVADPECRQVASMAYQTLLGLAGGPSGEEEEEAAAAAASNKAAAEAAWLPQMLREVVAGSIKTHEVDSATLWHVSALLSLLLSTKNLEFDEWQRCCVTYLHPFLGEEAAAAVCRALLAHAVELSRAGVAAEDDGWDAGEGEELCNCEFSLAYGGKILLNGARLRLQRGHRYGLCGANGVGKSTLLRAIAAGKVDGFPPKEQLLTVYVEHDIQGCDEDTSIVDFMCSHEALSSVGRVEIVRVLGSVGFTDEMLAGSVSCISGGWKMKLALARAMLMKADILLLDEPTNHLDVVNVAWLEHYLITQPNITCIIVSHDSAFLDKVCTDIVHYCERQLKRYAGNLSEFVKVHPEAQSYYQLEAATLKFRFPIPGLLDGITSAEKPILRCSKMSFMYPGSSRQQLTDVTLACRLSSRVAVLGVNGAGKSTLIKILTGELKPTGGQVVKHPNLRVAYVAQHAFHHIEHHLDKSPNQYIMNRYSAGEDKEEQSKVTRLLSPEEEAAIRDQVFMIDGHPRQLDQIVGRRKKRRSFEYEVSWKGLASLKYNRWFPREELEKRGFIKLLNEYDGKRAVDVVGDTRPLTKASIEQYLTDFGLEPEFGTHSAIRGLSGGQKVKLVLAAAMWHNPHLLIMDEPTNYLDRESLGALAAAVIEFQGGVVLISHHSEFTSAICNERWLVAEGRVKVEKTGAIHEDAETSGAKE